MDTYIAQAVAEAHVADLHREAARRRLGRSLAGRSARGTAPRRQRSGLRVAVGRLSFPSLTTRQAPDCCPA